MFHKIRRQLSYSNVAATMALVFALTGGAVAASSHGGSSSSSGGGSPVKARALVSRAGSDTAVIAKKKAKAPARGPAGPKGATGAAGPAGPVGPVGAKGENGAAGGAGPQGNPGTNGENGKPGESVTSATLAPGKGGCVDGGAEFKVGSGAATKACNGQTGFAEVLPSKKTEAGVWSFGAVNEGIVRIPITFATPLSAELNGEHVHFITEAQHGNPAKEINEKGEEVESTQCLGNSAKPTAQPGNLCVYTQFLSPAAPETQPFLPQIVSSVQAEAGSGAGPVLGAGENGVVVNIEAKSGGAGTGTWAVTAE